MTFETLIAPIPVAEFIHSHLGEKFAHIPGEADKVHHLLTWPQLNRLLELDSTFRYVNMWQKGREIDIETSVGQSLSAPAVSALIEQGATLVLNTIDQLHREIRLLIEDLSRSLECPTGANLYCSAGSEHGFDLHWDDHDVFVVQLAGHKLWDIYDAGSHKYPLRRGFSSDGDPVWSGCLETGEVLYIPRGWPHFVRPCGEPTVHLTIGIYRPKGIDYIKWVVANIEAHAAVRRDVPFDAALHAHYATEVSHVLANSVADPALFVEFMRQTKAARQPRTRFGFPWSLMEAVPEATDTFIELNAGRSFDRRMAASAEVIEVSFGGAVYAFDSRTEPLISYLERNCPVSIREFYEFGLTAFEKDTLRRFLSDIARAGLIAFRD